MEWWSSVDKLQTLQTVCFIPVAQISKTVCTQRKALLAFRARDAQATLSTNHCDTNDDASKKTKRYACNCNVLSPF